MKELQPEGPYYVGGMCEGARIDMARALEAHHEEVGLLAIFDTWAIENSQIRALWMVDYNVNRLRGFFQQPFSRKREFLASLLRKRKTGDQASSHVSLPPLPEIRWPELYWPGRDFVPPKFEGKITLFKMPKQPYYHVRDPLMGWGARTRAGVDLHVIPIQSKRHILIFREPHGQPLAGNLCAERAQRTDLEPAPVTAAQEAVMVSAKRPQS